jgi:hypothetical protein
MRIIQDRIPLVKVWEERETSFEEMLKIVVDIDRNLVAADAEMHADLEQLLLQDGSFQQNLWGANLFPLREKGDQTEYTSLINIRPAMGNRSMEVMDPDIRNKIDHIISKIFV